MNTARLRELVDKLLTVEGATTLSALLQRTTDAMQSVVNSPNQPDPQTQYASQFAALRTNAGAMLAAFTPAEMELLEEIGATRYFATDPTVEIASVSQQNAVTPAVVLAKLQEILGHRNRYIEHLKQLQAQLDALGIKANNVAPGTAELGILLPRPLFGNELAGLVSELSVLSRILRIFAEVVTGKYEPVEVRQISTTDPLFGLGMSVAVVVAVGKAVTWALATWKTVEEIRKLRNETQKNPAFSEKEIKSFFDSKIEKAIEDAIKHKAAEIAPPNGEGRGHELLTGMEWALRSILNSCRTGNDRGGALPTPEGAQRRRATPSRSNAAV